MRPRTLRPAEQRSTFTGTLCEYPHQKQHSRATCLTQDFPITPSQCTTHSREYVKNVVIENSTTTCSAHNPLVTHSHVIINLYVLTLDKSEHIQTPNCHAYEQQQYQDGLTSATIFCEMAIALRDQDESRSGSAMSPTATTNTSTTLSSSSVVPNGVGNFNDGVMDINRPSLLRRRLQDLHARYGEFAEDNGYVRCEDTEVLT